MPFSGAFVLIITSLANPVPSACMNGTALECLTAFYPYPTTEINNITQATALALSNAPTIGAECIPCQACTPQCVGNLTCFLEKKCNTCTHCGQAAICSDPNHSLFGTCFSDVPLCTSCSSCIGVNGTIDISLPGCVACGSCFDLVASKCTLANSTECSNCLETGDCESCPQYMYCSALLKGNRYKLGLIHSGVSDARFKIPRSECENFTVSSSLPLYSSCRPVLDICNECEACSECYGDMWPTPSAEEISKISSDTLANIASATPVGLECVACTACASPECATNLTCLAEKKCFKCTQCLQQLVCTDPSSADFSKSCDPVVPLCTGCGFCLGSNGEINTTAPGCAACGACKAPALASCQHLPQDPEKAQSCRVCQKTGQCESCPSHALCFPMLHLTSTQQQLSIASASAGAPVTAIPTENCNQYLNQLSVTFCLERPECSKCLTAPNGGDCLSSCNPECVTYFTCATASRCQTSEAQNCALNCGSLCKLKISGAENCPSNCTECFRSYGNCFENLPPPPSCSANTGVSSCASLLTGICDTKEFTLPNLLSPIGNSACENPDVLRCSLVTCTRTSDAPINSPSTQEPDSNSANHRQFHFLVLVVILFSTLVNCY